MSGCSLACDMKDQSSSGLDRGCRCDGLGDGGVGVQVGRCWRWRLDQLHVVGGEHSEVAVGAVAPPPALVDHLDPCDDLVGIEGDLRVVRCRRQQFNQAFTCVQSC